MSERAPYISEHPMADQDVKVGIRVYVPGWERGEVLGWDEATVIEVRRAGDLRAEQVTIVRFDDDTEALYFPYSIEAPPKPCTACEVDVCPTHDPAGYAAHVDVPAPDLP